MLSQEDNELVTRVGPRTPMGRLFREYWLPILTSIELAEPDGQPLRVRVLGEDLVAFRATSGQVGLLADKCSHRCAPLYYGRNEQDGLRCVYHGWKYDVAGNCVDMPNEPAESNFKEKIQHTAYPCQERSGVIWAYMGPRTTPPPFPGLEWGQLPDDHHVAAKITEHCNWLQILEGDLDTVHLDFLHSRLPGYDGPGPGVRPSTDRNPKIEIDRTDYGFVKGARRIVDDDNYYWRIYQFLLPAFVMLPAGRDTITYRVTVPIDDEHTSFWNGEYSPFRALTHEERARHLESRAIGGFAPSTGDPLTRWRPQASPENDYFLDYAAQKDKLFSGIPPVKLQDVAMTEGMGAILDRGSEHLGTTDGAIVQLRRALITAAKQLRDFGTVPPSVDRPELYAVRSATAIFPKTANWINASAEGLRAGRQPVLSVAPGR